MDPILNDDLYKTYEKLKDYSKPAISDLLSKADVAKIMINRSWKLAKGIVTSSVEERIHEETGEILSQYFANGFNASLYSQMKEVPYPLFDVNALGLGKMVKTRVLLKKQNHHI